MYFAPPIDYDAVMKQVIKMENMLLWKSKFRFLDISTAVD